MVVGGTAAGAHDEPTVAEVVQQRRLDGETDGMVESQLDDGEPDFQVPGSGGDGGAQHQRVGMGSRAVEMVLGEPYGVHSDCFGEQDLVERTVDDGRVVFRVMTDGEDKRTEAHFSLACVGTGTDYANDYSPL